MRAIENVLIYLTMGLLGIYLMVGFPFDIYLIMTFGLIIYFFRFLNYNKLKAEIKQADIVSIPIKNNSGISSFLSILAILLIIGFFVSLDYLSVIKLRTFTGIDTFVILFLFPIINIISYIKFSDLSNKYFIAANGIIGGFRFNDCISWASIDRIVVDNDKAVIRLQKDNKVLLKMKIQKKYFTDNIDIITKELNTKINVA
jgi:hypothetical protein